MDSQLPSAEAPLYISLPGLCRRCRAPIVWEGVAWLDPVDYALLPEPGYSDLAERQHRCWRVLASPEQARRVFDEAKAMATAYIRERNRLLELKQQQAQPCPTPGCHGLAGHPTQCWKAGP